jgi:enterochelin esterase family protein
MGTVMTLAATLLLMAQAPQVVSPEVRGDRTVTFRFKDAAASKVTLNMEGSPSRPMTKGADGVWSVTTPPLAPDLYGYTFSADGETRLDILNPNTKPNLIWPSNIVLVPGHQVWEVRDVPHGTVHHHYFHSALIGDDRDYLVYTPPGYRANGRTKYPVLYLLHGYSDTAVGWTDVGRAHTILDNLIAEGKARPMVVVMPLGYGVPNFHLGGVSRAAMPWERNITDFGKTLLGEVQPMVEHEYRVSTRPEDRAIAGLSMGGAETLTVGLNNLDRFAYVGAFSSGGLQNDFPKVFPKLTAEEANRHLRLLTISCGTEDGLIGFHRQFTAWLQDRKINHESREQPGAHTWMVWRRDLAAFAQRIFK